MIKNKNNREWGKVLQRSRFANFPYVIAEMDNGEGHTDAKVMAVKYPVTHHGGILVMPNEDCEYYEIGWNDLQFGDLDNILDTLPKEDV